LEWNADKRKPTVVNQRKAGLTKALRKAPYPSLASPTPAERRAELERRLAAQGIQPIDDFDRYLAEVGDFWPADETCDEFLSWLRAARREGRS
jgi:hypothetical protein